MKRIKRINGTGTIAQRKRKHGIIYEVLSPADEKGKRKKLGQFTLYREALEFLNEYILNPWDMDKQNIKFKDLFKLYFKSKEKTGVTVQTLKGYNASFKRCYKLHDMKIKDFKTPFLRDFINTLKNTTGLVASSGTKEITKTFLSNLFNYAVENELLHRNVASFTMSIKKEKIKVINIFTNEEIKELWKLSKKFYYAKIILIMIYTGLRNSETRNLKKENILIDKNIIVNSGGKTEKGKGRTIYIHRDIKQILIDLMAESKTDYIFTNSKNKVIAPTTFITEFKKTCLMLGTKHTPHDTRHTYATILYRNGLRDKYIMDLVGHTDIKMTTSVYTHLESADIENQLNNIDFKIN